MTHAGWEVRSLIENLNKSTVNIIYQNHLNLIY